MTDEFFKGRDEALAEAAKLAEFMAVGGRAWTEEQAIAADTLFAVAENIRLYAAGKLPPTVAERIRNAARAGASHAG